MAERKPFDDRLHELVAELGKKWTDISVTLGTEGYAQTGMNLQPDALRKRYRRISNAGERPAWPQVREAKLTPQAEMRAAEVAALPKLAEVLERLWDKMEGGSPKQPPLEYDALRMEMIKEHLLHTLERQLDKRLENMKRELLHDLQGGMKDTLHEIKQEIILSLDEQTSEKLERARQGIVNTLDERSLEMTDTKLGRLKEELQRDMRIALAEMLEAKFQSELGHLLDGIDLKEKTAGPGRGHKGSSVTKFSATIPDELYNKLKSFGGLFSSHLAAACTLYVKARQKYPTQED